MINIVEGLYYCHCASNLRAFYQATGYTNSHINNMIIPPMFLEIMAPFTPNNPSAGKWFLQTRNGTCHRKYSFVSEDTIDFEEEFMDDKEIDIIQVMNTFIFENATTLVQYQNYPQSSTKIVRSFQESGMAAVMTHSRLDSQSRMHFKRFDQNQPMQFSNIY